MLDIVDDVRVANDETAKGCEALRECAHRDVDFFYEAEMRGGSPATAEYSDRVRIVDI